MEEKIRATETNRELIRAPRTNAKERCDSPAVVLGSRTVAEFSGARIKQYSNVYSGTVALVGASTR
jgi:hypothetical protein